MVSPSSLMQKERVQHRPVCPHLCFTESKGCGTHTRGASRCKGIFVIYKLLPLSLTRMPVHAHDWLNNNLN